MATYNKNNSAKSPTQSSPPASMSGTEVNPQATTAPSDYEQLTGFTPEESQSASEQNLDPLSGEPGSHPVGVGLGAAVGGLAAGAIAGSAGGPIGTMLGAIVGGIAGGYAGKAVAENIDPTSEAAYWRDEYPNRPYSSKEFSYDDFEPAYQAGWSTADLRKEDWDSTEPLAKDAWEKAGGSAKMPWDQARHAAKDASERVRSQTETSGRTCYLTESEQQELVRSDKRAQNHYSSATNSRNQDDSPVSTSSVEASPVDKNSLPRKPLNPIGETGLDRTTTNQFNKSSEERMFGWQDDTENESQSNGVSDDHFSLETPTSSGGKGYPSEQTNNLPKKSNDYASASLEDTVDEEPFDTDDALSKSNDSTRTQSVQENPIDSEKSIKSKKSKVSPNQPSKATSVKNSSTGLCEDTKDCELPIDQSNTPSPTAKPR